MGFAYSTPLPLNLEGWVITDFMQGTANQMISNTCLFLWKNFMKGQWQNIIAVPVANILDFISCLFHTGTTNRQEAHNGSTIYRGTQAKYIKNPPKGMTARLVKNITDSDLLDMHYFLTEDDDLDEDEFEEVFYIF